MASILKAHFSTHIFGRSDHVSIAIGYKCWYWGLLFPLHVLQLLCYLYTPYLVSAWSVEWDSLLFIRTYKCWGCNGVFPPGKANIEIPFKSDDKVAMKRKPMISAICPSQLFCIASWQKSMVPVSFGIERVGVLDFSVKCTVNIGKYWSLKDYRGKTI